MAHLALPHFVARLTHGLRAPASRLPGSDPGRGTASLLLAAGVAAILVLANQVVESWTDGHLFLAWILMWTTAFAALALLVRPLRAVGARLQRALQAVAAHHRQQLADDLLWEHALRDARVMADLSRAMDASSAARD